MAFAFTCKCVRAFAQLSTRYSDQSVLERHHIASSFDVMLDPKSSLLGGLTEDDYRTVRKLMVDLVLFTDLAKHYEFISKLKTLNEMVAMSRTSERGSSRSSSMLLDFWKSCAALIRSSASQVAHLRGTPRDALASLSFVCNLLHPPPQPGR